MLSNNNVPSTGVVGCSGNGLGASGRNSSSSSSKRRSSSSICCCKSNNTSRRCCSNWPRLLANSNTNAVSVVVSERYRNHQPIIYIHCTVLILVIGVTAAVAYANHSMNRSRGGSNHCNSESSSSSISERT